MFPLRRRRTSARTSSLLTPAPAQPSLHPSTYVVPLTACEEQAGGACVTDRYTARTPHTSDRVNGGGGGGVHMTHEQPSAFKLAPLHILPPPAFAYANATTKVPVACCDDDGGVDKAQVAAAVAAVTTKATTAGGGGGGGGVAPGAAFRAARVTSSSLLPPPSQPPSQRRQLTTSRTSVGARELIDAVFAATSMATSTRRMSSSSFSSSSAANASFMRVALARLVGAASIDRDVDNPRNVGLAMPLPTEPVNAATGMRSVYLSRQLPPVTIVAEQRHRCIAIALHSCATPAVRSRTATTTTAATSTRGTAALLPPPDAAADGYGADAHTHAGNKSSSGAGNDSSRGSSSTTTTHSNGISDSADVAPPLASPTQAAAALLRAAATATMAEKDEEHLYFGTVLGYTSDDTALVWHNRAQRFASRVPVASIARVYRVVVGRCWHCGLVFLRSEMTVHVRTHLKGGGVAAGVVVGDAVMGIACGDTALLRTLVYHRPLGEGAQGVVDLYTVGATATRLCAQPQPPPPASQPPSGPSRVRQQMLLVANNNAAAAVSATTLSAQQQQQHRDTALVSLTSDADASTTAAVGEGAVVAVKTMSFASSDVARDSYYRAVRFMTSASHPCLVEYLVVQLMPDQRTVRIVMPCYHEGDLTSFVRDYRGDRLSEAFVCTLALQLAQALSCLHTRSPPIVHGDVKMDNIMLCNGARRVVLMDLDASCEMRDNHSTTPTHAGTTAYMAPEALRRARVMPASDMWSLGVVLYVLVMLPEFPMIIDPDTMQPILLNADTWATEDDVQLLQSVSSGSYDTDKPARGEYGASLSQRAPRRMCSVPLDECVRINISRRGYSSGLTQLIVDLLRFNPLRRPSAATTEQRLRTLLTQLQHA